MEVSASRRKCQNAAALVGQRRVDRGVVEVHDLLAGVALVVLVDGVADGAAAAPEPLPCVT
jgi:hypothetical protein